MVKQFVEVVDAFIDRALVVRLLSQKLVGTLLDAVKRSLQVFQLQRLLPGSLLACRDHSVLRILPIAQPRSRRNVLLTQLLEQVFVESSELL